MPHGLIGDFIRLIESLQGNPLSVPAFIALYSAACFVAPISLFPVAGGVLFGFWTGLGINLGACLLGASGAYFLARGLGRARLTRWVSRLHHHERILEALDDPAPGAFILLRLLGFPPFVITNYLAGLSKMSWPRFLWTSAVGLFPWTFLMTYFAQSFWAALKKAGMSGFQSALKEFRVPLICAVLVLAAVGLFAIYIQGRWADKPGRSRKG